MASALVVAISPTMHDTDNNDGNDDSNNAIAVVVAAAVDVKQCHVRTSILLWSNQRFVRRLLPKTMAACIPFVACSCINNIEYQEEYSYSYLCCSGGEW